MVEGEITMKIKLISSHVSRYDFLNLCLESSHVKISKSSRVEK